MSFSRTCFKRLSRGKSLLGAAILSILWLALSSGCTSNLFADDKPAIAAGDFEEAWQVVYINQERVGFGRSTVSREKLDSRELVATHVELSLVITRFGQPIKIKMTTKTNETVDGEIKDFAFELDAPPAVSQRTRGRVENDMLLVETETNGKVHKRDPQPWDPSIKSPTYQHRLLKSKPMKPGEKRSFTAYVPELQSIGTFSLEAAEFENVKLLAGKTARLLRVTMKQSLIPSETSQEYVDAEGECLKETSQIAGLPVAMYTVDKEEALKALSNAEVDLVVATMVKVPAIPNPRKTRRVVYRVTTPGEDPARALYVGGGQSFERVAADTVDLTVQSLVPPAEGPAENRDPGKEFISPNSFLQSDDKLIVANARQAVGEESDAWKAAQLMERWVYEKIRKKNFSTFLATAAEVAKDLSGDCTEHSVLLAAMCRARGIPSRVAMGLVYAPKQSGFAGHMWTEVFVKGMWIPLDATLGDGRVAAEHIKFADTSLADTSATSPLTSFLPLAGVLGKLKIVVRDVKYE
jgi:hypothetical protein